MHVYLFFDSTPSQLSCSEEPRTRGSDFRVSVNKTSLYTSAHPNSPTRPPPSPNRDPGRSRIPHPLFNLLLGAGSRTIGAADERAGRYERRGPGREAEAGARDGHGERGGQASADGGMRKGGRAKNL